MVMHIKQQQCPISGQIALAYERLLVMSLEEMQLLHEQVEFLLELLESGNLSQSSKQTKIQELEQELSMTNHDLSTALMLNRLSFHEVKAVAQSILKNENSAGESCTKLINAIYGTTVHVEELQQLDKVKFDVATDYSHNITKISHQLSLKSRQIKNHLQQIYQEFNELEDKFLKLQSQYERIRSSQVLHN
jgi:Glu-tRNA(Gln) amidotransferase subunit E-like FAD-binding protein